MLVLSGFSFGFLAYSMILLLFDESNFGLVEESLFSTRVSPFLLRPSPWLGEILAQSGVCMRWMSWGLLIGLGRPLCSWPSARHCREAFGGLAILPWVLISGVRKLPLSGRLIPLQFERPFSVGLTLWSLERLLCQLSTL